MFTEPIEVSDDRVLSLLEEAVDLKGEDYVYSPPATYSTEKTCFNVHLTEPGKVKPGCLIGHWMWLLDPERFESAQWATGEDTNSNLISTSAASGMLLEHFNVQVSREAEQALSLAQQQQDTGSTWGQAIIGAKATLRAEVSAS